MKQLNFGYLLSQEEKVAKITKETFKKPLTILDESTKFFMKLLDSIYMIYTKTEDKQLKNYCKYFLTTGNAVIHLIRVSRYAILTGYYGNVMVLMRTIINYLNMSMHIHHHPEDAELLLKESRDSFKKNKEYKKKFHEYNLKRELIKIGYKIPEQFDDVAKSTHGSLWGAQVFGFKGIKTSKNQYELHYSPLFSMLQSTTYLSFIISIPTDFSIYCLRHLKEKNIKIDQELLEKFREIDRKVRISIYAMEQNYQFVRNTPKEIQDALVMKIKEANKERDEIF